MVSVVGLFENWRLIYKMQSAIYELPRGLVSPSQTRIYLATMV